MVTRKHTPAERAFWRQAFLAAELPTLIRGNGKRLSPEGLAHLAAEYADAALREYRTRFAK